MAADFQVKLLSFESKIILKYYCCHRFFVCTFFSFGVQLNINDLIVKSLHFLIVCITWHCARVSAFPNELVFRPGRFGKPSVGRKTATTAAGVEVSTQASTNNADKPTQPKVNYLLQFLLIILLLNPRRVA